MKLIIRILRRLLGVFFPAVRHVRFAYSQEGEDVLLQSLMEDFPRDYKGVYVDVGAHHPFRFSNTYLFYLNGWYGINIDATPGSMEPFKKHRSRDINLEMGIGKEKGVLPFYKFNEPALNTFSKAKADDVNGKHGYKLLEEVPVPIDTLGSVLATHLPKGVSIDFLTIDVEGLDLDVLKSNDWSRFRPQFILAEIPLTSHQKNETVVFLQEQGYEPTIRTPRTMMFNRVRN